MNSALLRLLVSTGRPLVNLQSFAQHALTFCVPSVAALQGWARTAGGSSGMGLVRTGTAGAAALVMLVYIVFLRLRIARETQKLRRELAEQASRAKSAESAN